MPDFAEHSSKQVGLLTLHRKEQVIAPILANAFDWQVITTTDFDTDQLGTFSGETERVKTALACAEQKAKLACELTGLPLGLGSEGSFGAGPYGGLLPWNEELITVVDQQHNWYVTGIAQGPSFHRHRLVNSEQQLISYINEIATTQALILYPQSRPTDTLFKGLLGLQNVLAAYRECKNRYHQEVMVEFDLRAMYCPERRIRIAEATNNLVERLQNSCPSCQQPGFWPDNIVDGLPCQSCYLPTNEVAMRIAVCVGCQYQQKFPVPSQYADPYHCPHCNP